MEPTLQLLDTEDVDDEADEEQTSSSGHPSCPIIHQDTLMIMFATKDWMSSLDSVSLD